MGRQASLNTAKRNKDDEFYTRYEDIDKAVQRYHDKFAGKCVYMPCDDPNWSNFWRYFHEHFTDLGLKRIICTFISLDNPHYALSYTGGNDADILQGERIPLDFDGDFYSGDALNFYAQCDIVCTNPPFSLFRKFADTVLQFDIDLLCIAASGSAGYLNIFSYIKSGRLRAADLVGYSDGMSFIHGKEEARILAMWYTTFESNGRVLNLTAKYDHEKYPVLDNYDAINVNYLADIPCDYEGLMAVPQTIVSCLESGQFELIDILKSGYLDGSELFNRFIIKLNKKFINRQE